MNTQLPTINDVLSNPGTSYWLKDALKGALLRDPVDSANDAELLAALLSQRAEASLVPASIVCLNAS